jgi:hypothetical protein
MTMEGTRLLGAIFLILGIMALAYGGFTYTHKEEKARVGPVRIEDKDRVNIPLWVGVATAVGGAALLMAKVRD